ncbi:MAG: lamin tail domain-containing protein [Chitinispirillaceae bacterium]|nr:lamin tail domain-containing protein [Chitinispirillaceae bacterium]
MKTTLLAATFTTALFLEPFVTSTSAQVKINEFLANNVWNKAEIVDYNDFSDWIELHNKGSSAANIGGYYLTGSLKNPKKAQIPSGTSIPAKVYLLFWADEDRRQRGRAAMISPEMASQASKWGSQGGIKSVSAWQSEISSMKKFCNERGAIEMKNLAKDITGGTAKLTVNVTNTVAGDIYIEGVRMCEGLSGMTFFKGAPLGIKAVPKPGCKLKSLGSGSTDSTTRMAVRDRGITRSPYLQPSLHFSCLQNTIMFRNGFF